MPHSPSSVPPTSSDSSTVIGWSRALGSSRRGPSSRVSSCWARTSTACSPAPAATRRARGAGRPCDRWCVSATNSAGIAAITVPISGTRANSAVSRPTTTKYGRPIAQKPNMANSPTSERHHELAAEEPAERARRSFRPSSVASTRRFAGTSDARAPADLRQVDQEVEREQRAEQQHERRPDHARGERREPREEDRRLARPGPEQLHQVRRVDLRSPAASRTRPAPAGTGSAGPGCPSRTARPDARRSGSGSVSSAADGAAMHDDVEQERPPHAANAPPFQRSDRGVQQVHDDQRHDAAAGRRSGSGRSMYQKNPATRTSDADHRPRQQPPSRGARDEGARTGTVRARSWLTDPPIHVGR